jgi:PAS domain S-box-containing protein
MAMKHKNSIFAAGNVSRMFWLLALGWSIVAGGSLAWNMNLVKRYAVDEALIQAKASFERDFVFRRWNAGHGGVYVPVTKTTQPNPYLEHIPDRDITTTSGKRLTLINPAYMSREVYEMMAKQTGGTRSHITSLKPIRASNEADAWETESLRKFEQGASEVFSLEKMDDGREYFRYMHKLVVEKPCLKCHATQGYKLGDIGGGISISIPAQPREAMAAYEMRGLSYGHGALWLAGLGIIFISGRRQRGKDAEIRESEARFRLLLDSTAEAIYGIDVQENCTFANPACLKMLGYDHVGEVLGKNTHALFHHSHPDGSPYPIEECPIAEVVQQGEGRHGVDEMMWRKDGTGFLVEFWSYPVFEHEKLTGAVVTFLDISERKQAQHALNKRLDELERFQQAAISREFRMKELMDELAALKAEKEHDSRG